MWGPGSVVCVILEEIKVLEDQPSERGSREEGLEDRGEARRPADPYIEKEEGRGSTYSKGAASTLTLKQSSDRLGA